MTSISRKPVNAINYEAKTPPIPIQRTSSYQSIRKPVELPSSKPTRQDQRSSNHNNINLHAPIFNATTSLSQLSNIPTNAVSRESRKPPPPKSHNPFPISKASIDITSFLAEPIHSMSCDITHDHIRIQSLQSVLQNVCNDKQRIYDEVDEWNNRFMIKLNTINNLVSDICVSIGVDSKMDKHVMKLNGDRVDDDYVKNENQDQVVVVDNVINVEIESHDEETVVSTPKEIKEIIEVPVEASAKEILEPMVSTSSSNSTLNMDMDHTDIKGIEMEHKSFMDQTYTSDHKSFMKQTSSNSEDTSLLDISFLVDIMNNYGF